MFSGFAFGESAFYIFYTVVGGVTVEIEGPIRAVVFAVKPCGRRLAQGGQQIRLDLPVPGQDLLRGALAPTNVDVTVLVVCVQPAHLLRTRLLSNDPRDVRLPECDVGEGILDRPGILGFGAGQWTLPIGGF